MRVAVLLYRQAGAGIESTLAWVDPFAGKPLRSLPVPISPNVGVFPSHDCALISYSEFPDDSPATEWLDVYRLSDWSRAAHLPMEYRAKFNVTPEWTTFLPSRRDRIIYVYQAHTLGDHWAEDFVSGLDLASNAFTSWNFRVPECVAGWSAAVGRAEVQMLHVADGIEVGKLPSSDFEQKVAFWLGPEEGMGPTIPIGPRPRAHSDLGHARAILCAPRRPLSIVVCNDGAAHLIDPLDFRYLEKQQVKFALDHAMPVFAAQVEPQGRLLYVGASRPDARSQGLVERVVVHDLDRNCRKTEWLLPEPFVHTALTEDGKYFCGGSRESNQLWILDASNGEPAAVMQLHGSPQYVIPCS